MTSAFAQQTKTTEQQKQKPNKTQTTALYKTIMSHKGWLGGRKKGQQQVT